MFPSDHETMLGVHMVSNICCYTFRLSKDKLKCFLDFELVFDGAIFVCEYPSTLNMVGEIPRDTSEISLDTSSGRLEVISSLLKKVDVIMLLRDSYCHTS